MKKLLALGAFIMMGSMVFAQTPSKQKAAPSQATTMQLAPVVAEEVSVSTIAVAEKKETKKECSDADKKQCGSKTSGKKSCCSSKATKEETR